jgi:hypothetical protein
MSNTDPRFPEERQTPDEGAARSLRWMLIRDLLIFVTKASLEAARDIALIPTALIAGVAGMLLSPSKPDAYFEQVLEIGDEFDEFVDLFGKEKRRDSGSRFDAPEEDDGLLRADDFFDLIEKAVVAEYKRGGVTAQAKTAIDHGLDVVHQSLGGPAAPSPASQVQTKDTRSESE